MSLQIRRGTEAQRTAVTFDSGEPAWVTDTQTLYVGDGSTAGGVIPKARTTGAAGGDLTGTYPDPTVAKIRGNTVQAGTPSNNQSLVYKTATGQWELANPAIAGSTVASGAVSDGDNLIYNASTGQWEHAPDRIGNRTVSATAPTAGQTIIWNSSSSQWEPAAGRIGTTAISATAPSNNQVLLYNSSTTQWEPGNCRIGQYSVQNVAPTADQTLVYSSTNSRWEPTSARLATKTYATFTPLMNQPPATNYATADTRNSIAVLDFDATTDESAVFVGIMPEGAALGSGLKVRLHWMATSATSGTCRWGVQIERMNTDLDADSFDTAATAGTATNATSGILTVTEITVTTIDSLAAGEPFRLKVYRDADGTSGTDDMTGDAELVVVEVRSAV